MTKFMINYRTNAWNTYVNLLNRSHSVNTQKDLGSLPLTLPLYVWDLILVNLYAENTTDNPLMQLTLTWNHNYMFDSNHHCSHSNHHCIPTYRQEIHCHCSWQAPLAILLQGLLPFMCEHSYDLTVVAPCHWAWWTRSLIYVHIISQWLVVIKTSQ